MKMMTWDEFVTLCRAEFGPTIEVQKLAREIQDLRQTTETVAKITVKLKDMALLVPQYVADEEMKNTRYHDMLRDNIREFVGFSACRTL